MPNPAVPKDDEASRFTTIGFILYDGEGNSRLLPALKNPKDVFRSRASTKSRSLYAGK
jgi:hypothetical protein